MSILSLLKSSKWYLHDAVGLCGGRQARRRVNLDEPGLELVVHDDVVPVALEAVLVAHHHWLHRLVRQTDGEKWREKKKETRRQINAKKYARKNERE